MATSTRIPKFLFIFFIGGSALLHSNGLSAQASQTVSEIITTYNTYFKSSTTAINPVNPDNSHELLAFTFGGTRYSTGVNDALLTANGDGTFSAQVYKTLPLNNISGTVSSNTKLALGQMYDGVDNGASKPAPVNSLIQYLTDGTNGLDLGTGVANLPAGTLKFGIANINPLSIGDGVPDVLITQIADPSAGVDKYEFTTASDATVGNIVNISFQGINAVANWTADFYEASTNPPTLTASFTNSARPLRLWAADFSYFGITTENYTTITNFIIHLNGNSDIAFIAYNNASAFITLPVTLSVFESTVNGSDVTLKWQTASENNSSHFIIESSTDGNHFIQAGQVQAAGNSAVAVNYTYTVKNLSEGTHYFRLKQVDRDGRISYSSIVKENIRTGLVLNLLPNPAKASVSVLHPAGKKDDVLKIFSSAGKLLLTQAITTGSNKTIIHLATLPAGNYIVQWSSHGQQPISTGLIVQ